MEAVNPGERYEQLLVTDPSVPHVAEDIRRGARWGYGPTDVHDHLPVLREAARGKVVEIGVRFGASTAALLAGVEDNGGHLWSVDVEDCSYARSLFDGHPQWTFIRANSVWQAEDLREELPKEPDLVFIDGEHSREAVVSDLLNYAGLLRAKVVMLHDASDPEVLGGIFHFLQGDWPFRSLRLLTGSHGLAVLS